MSLEAGRVEDAQQYLRRYRAIAEPSARSLWVGIQVARASNDHNSVASQALMLKNLFEHSPEYTAYLESERSAHVTRSSQN
jgi:type IV pilus assembly protein PilF